MILAKTLLAVGIISIAATGYGRTVGCGAIGVEDGPSVSISLNNEIGSVEQISVAYSEGGEARNFDQMKAQISNTVPIGYYAGRNSASGDAVAIDISAPWTNQNFSYKGTMTIFSSYGVELFNIGCNVRNE